MKFLVTLIASVCLFFTPAIAGKTTQTSESADATTSKSAEQTLSEVRYVETAYKKKRRKKKSYRNKSRKKKSYRNKKRKRSAKKGRRSSKRLSTIKNDAIANSLSGLSRLRPYSTNYKRLQSAVRSYWRRNVTRPSASRLTSTILRYVKPKYRKRAKPKILASTAKGVAKVKVALRKK